MTEAATFALEDLDRAQLQRVYNRTADEVKAPKATFKTTAEALRRTRKMLKLVGNDTGRVADPGPATKPSDTEPREPTATPKKPATKAKTSGTKKPATKAKAGTRTKRVTYARDDKIKVLVTENPKKRAAAERFNLYKTGMTVKGYIDAVTKAGTGNSTEAEQQALRDIAWDVKQGFISIENS